MRDFLETAFDHAGLDWHDHVKFDERFIRPAEVDALVGDASKAESELGWKATVRAHDLARLMVDADRAALANVGPPQPDTVTLASWSP